MTQCVREYYDRDEYNWLAYQNSCGDAVHITLVGRGGRWSGALDVGAGRHGKHRHERSRGEGRCGLEAYACPAHYAAVDANDQLIIAQYVTSYRCKKNY